MCVLPARLCLSHDVMASAGPLVVLLIIWLLISKEIPQLINEIVENLNS